MFMSLLKFFPPLKIVKEQQASQFNKEKGTPFFSDFFYSYPFLLFLPLNSFIFSYLPKESFEKTTKKGQIFLFFSLFKNYSDSDTTRTSPEVIPR